MRSVLIYVADKARRPPSSTAYCAPAAGIAVRADQQPVQVPRGRLTCRTWSPLAAGCSNAGSRTVEIASDPPILSPGRHLAVVKLAASGYSIRIPEIARAMTSCWICSVPSKMS
jgi:hypothetical protein